MLRGTIVKVNDKVRVPHLVAMVGIAVERNKLGRIKVLHQHPEGFIVALYHAEDQLDIIEAPIEL